MLSVELEDEDGIKQRRFKNRFLRMHPCVPMLWAPLGLTRDPTGPLASLWW
jgi:hypothetical protein